MKFFIKQHYFSWGDKFSIYNESDQVVYTCQGKVFSFGKKLTLYDTNGEQVAYIEQKIPTLLPTYKIHTNKEHDVTLVEKFSFLKHNYYFKDRDWTIEGNFLAHQYQLLDRETVIMRIDKEWLTFGDCYCIDINDNYDQVLAICISIVIDCVCHNKK